MPFPEHHEKFKLFQTRTKAEGKPYPADQDEAVIVARAEQHGIDSLSCWPRAVHDLVNEGKIKLLAAPARPVEISEDFQQQLDRMSSTELRIKLNRDPVFAELYGRWAALPLAAPKPVTLTREDYMSTPSTEIQRRYRNEPLYKAAVD